LEKRQLLAVQAALSAGVLRISFTPSTTLPEQVARLSSDGVNYTVRNTNNVSIGTFSVSATNSIAVTGSSGVDRLELPSTGLQPIGDPLTVSSTIETTVIARAVTPVSGGVEIGSPATILSASVTTPGSQTYAGNVTLGGVVTARTIAADAFVRFEGVVSGGAGSSVEIDTAGPSELLGGLGGGAGLTKRGSGSLRVTNAGSLGGGTAIEAGEVTVRQATALGSGVHSIGGLVRLRLDTTAERIPVPGLALASGARVDLTTGGMRIAARWASGSDSQKRRISAMSRETRTL